jgi:hypothetical protein
VVQIEQMRAHLKGFSARIVISSESMVTCSVTDQKPKNVLPISVVTRNFLFIFDKNY